MPRSEDESIASFVRHAADEQVVASAIQPGYVLAGRFTILFKHGEGGMGQVFAAQDSVRQTQVAVKLLGKRTPQSISLLKREFRAAADIVHPNLVRLHELFADAADCFFSMESVRGSTLPMRLSHMQSRDLGFVRRVMSQLAQGLAALHDAGTLHADLKPSNFLITEGEDRVVLLDFGLSRSKWANQPFELSGTPRYWAPEQERAQPLSEASDWYAFGVVLHEALCGELPGRTPSAARLRDAPVELVELCLALLRAKPADRPKRDAILDAFGVDPAWRASSIPTPPPTASAVPALIGRDGELERLNESFRATLGGGPRIVLIHGPSGIGKTTVVQNFVRKIRSEGAFALEGLCRERESIGYKAIDSLIDDVIAQLARLPPAAAAELVPANIADLLMVFPALRRSDAIANASQPKPEQRDYARVHRRAIRAFGALIAGLRRLRPLVIWLDDLQWSDRESALLLGPVLGGSEPVDILLIGTHRGELEAGGPLLAAMYDSPHLQLPAATKIVLGPLASTDAEKLASSLLPGQRSDRDLLARDIGRDAGGNPLFIAELAHAAEQLQRDESLPLSLVDLVVDRVHRLPTPARELLEVVAVAGEPMPRDLLRRGLALPPAGAEEAIDVLRANRLVRSVGAGEHGAIDSHHDRIREIVMHSMTDAARRRRHVDLAILFESSNDCPPARLAHHYEAAGEGTRAGPYFTKAADHAFAALAFSHAAELYAKGIELSSLDRDALRDVRLRRAEALSLAGKGPDAADIFLSIARRSPADQALKLRRRAAQELLLAGHLAQGLTLIEEVLRAVGMQPTRGGRSALVPLMAGRLWLDVRGFRYVPRDESRLTRGQQTQLDTAWMTAASLAFTDPIRAAEFQTRHMRLALRAGEPRRVLRALSLEAFSAAASGARAAPRMAEVLAAAKTSAALANDVSARALLLLARGLCEYLQGRLEPALELCQESLATGTERGAAAVWQRVNAQRFVLSSLFFLGRLPELAAFLTPLLAEVEGTRNLTAATVFRTGYSTAVWLATDELQEADRQLALARDEIPIEGGFDLVQYGLLIGQTLRDMYAGDFEFAHARLREVWSLVAASQFLRISVIRVQLMHLRAALAAALANQFDARGQVSVARELRSQMRRAARKLANESLPRARALSLLLESTVDFAEGHRDRARRKLALSAEQFDSQHMQLFAAASRLRAGEFTRRGGDEQIRSAQAEFERQGVANPQRFIALFAPGFPGS